MRTSIRKTEILEAIEDYQNRINKLIEENNEMSEAYIEDNDFGHIYGIAENEGSIEVYMCMIDDLKSELSELEECCQDDEE